MAKNLFEARAVPASVQPLPTVVVVDDDQTILAALRIVLGKAYRVETYSDPVVGARAAAMPGVALAIIDVKMPQYDGFWVFQKIREANSSLPVIFSSAHGEVQLPKDLSALKPPEASVGKTGNLKEFLSVVQRVVQKKQH